MAFGSQIFWIDKIIRDNSEYKMLLETHDMQEKGEEIIGMPRAVHKNTLIA